MPASPLVTRQYTISLPCAVQRATAAAEPNSRSSGWATTASARCQSSHSDSYDAMSDTCSIGQSACGMLGPT